MSNIAWADYEKNQYGIIRGGLSGQSGDMPPEQYLKKIERTCIYEQEDQLDEHFRSTLRDTTPDAPTLAQDLPRSQDAQNTLRSEILNIRHAGARSAAEPIHPDLFLGFTERDERGYHNSGPDLRRVVSQSRARGRYKDFVSDHASDWTVPSGSRSELRAIRDFRKTIDPFRQRLKIFGTAFDSRSTPYQGTRSQHVSGVSKTAPDGMILNLNDLQAANHRKDNTSLRSDVIKVGYRQTGDHRFSVAQYGLTSSKQKYTNIHASQYKGNISHEYNNTPSEVKNRLTVSIMKEAGRRKHLEDYRGEMEFNFKKSMQSQNKIKKLVADLISTQRNTAQSAELIDLGYVNNTIKKVRIYDPVAHDAVIVDKSIFDKVNEHKNITFVKNTNVLARRDVIASEGKALEVGNETQVYVYSSKQPGHIVQLPTRTDNKWYDSQNELLYKKNRTRPQTVDQSYTEQDQGLSANVDRVFNRYSKRSGYHQGMSRATDGSLNADPINDTTTFTPASTRMAGRRAV